MTKVQECFNTFTTISIGKIRPAEEYPFYNSKDIILFDNYKNGYIICLNRTSRKSMLFITTESLDNDDILSDVLSMHRRYFSPEHFSEDGKYRLV